MWGTGRGVPGAYERGGEAEYAAMANVLKETIFLGCP